ncbi:MAG: SixA phosphatase family protein [Propioniciclava sp.]
MNRTLVVMRHAKSSWKTNEADLNRPLSGRGTRDAVVAGQELAGTTFDVVLLSPAQRAAQTWQCLAMNGVAADDVQLKDELYHAWTPQVVALLRDLPPAAGRVLVVGHEPTVSDLVLTLAGPSPFREQIERKFPTSGLALVTTAGPWTDLGPGRADLVAFEVPRG